MPNIDAIVSLSLKPRALRENRDGHVICDGHVSHNRQGSRETSIIDVTAKPSDSLLPRWPYTIPYLITEMEGYFIVFPNKYFHTFIEATSTVDGVSLKEKERKKEI